ncbi:MAG: hypothetical protein ACETWT_05780 [Thermodesulfobacteriota bacterium]
MLLAPGLILCASINTLLQLYALYGIFVGAGATCIAILPYTAILAHWFERRKGITSDPAVSGIGLLTFFVPLLQHFMSLWGWPLAFVALGVLVLIILLPLNALLLRHKPEELGLYPDGVGEGGSPKRKGVEVMDPVWSETD